MIAYDVRAQRQAARDLAPKSKGGKGQAVTLNYQGPGAYDTATGAMVQPIPAAQDSSGVELAYEAHRIDGTNILTGDTKFMLSPLTIQGVGVVLAGANDAGETTLTMADGVPRRVISIEPFKPAGLLVYAYLQLRGA
jgi:hypothetical protein